MLAIWFQNLYFAEIRSLSPTPSKLNSKCSVYWKIHLLWRNQSLCFTLPEWILIWDSFLCLFTHAISPAALWQVEKYAVIPWNLCMPDNFCPGSANTDTIHLLDKTVSGVTVLVSRWVFDAISSSCWVFSCLCNRIYAKCSGHILAQLGEQSATEAL